MAQESTDEWMDEEPDLPPPEPAPAGWAAPTPPEAAAASVTVETPQIVEEPRDFRTPPSKARRFWITTSVYGVLYIAALITIDWQAWWVALVFLLPVYLLTLPFVLRTPRAFRGAKAKKVRGVDWQAKLMVSVVVFLALYVPFTFVTGPVIPYASLVEYLVFTALLFLLLRLGGRAAGVAPSLDALPPPTHRLHQQIVTPIDDAHYQRTLWLNYSFVEKGRGARHLARRVDEILDANGVEPGRRATLLAELHEYEDSGFHLGRRGRDRRGVERDHRADVLGRLYESLKQEMETRA